jgi:hypothetical protein
METSFLMSQGRAVAASGFCCDWLWCSPMVRWYQQYAFNYKNFNMEFLIDFRAGGDIFSGTNLRMTQNGSTKQSVHRQRG